MKKKIITFMLVVSLALSLNIIALAAESYPEFNDQVLTEFSSRIEETEWYYRDIDGKIQKRLWSITENKWLTNWMDVKL